MKMGSEGAVPSTIVRVHRLPIYAFPLDMPNVTRFCAISSKSGVSLD